VKLVLFEDDSFLFRGVEEIRKFAMEYKREIGLPFGIELNPNETSKEKLSILKDAGLGLIHIGIQSGDEKIRKELYHRNTSDNAIIKCNKILTGLNILHKYDIMVDGPFNDSRPSLDLLRKLKPYFSINLYSIKLYPGLELEEIFRNLGYEQWLTQNETARSFYEVLSQDSSTLVLRCYERFPPNKIWFLFIHYLANSSGMLWFLNFRTVQKIIRFILKNLRALKRFFVRLRVPKAAVQ
jgi:radical SAM superfamily enzyme YgiQ (UPF0313 family)